MHFIVFLLFTAGLVAAEEGTIPNYSPLWELGAGVGLVAAPDYPGSDHANLWLLPFPFGVYRGEIIRSDRGGAMARLFRSASYEFNVSAGGGLPSSARKGGAREGMPDLEWVGEIGPRMMVHLWRQRDGPRMLRFGLPVRSVLSTNFRRFTDRGFILAPELLYDNPDVFGTGWDAFIRLSADFLDRRFANYFYGVAPEHARSDRPSYVARAGHLQTELSLGLMIPFRESRVRVFSFVSMDSLKGSANRSSPLFRSEWNMSYSLVVMWVFAESDKRVPEMN